MAAKSYSPAMPSVKVARSRYSPRYFSFATLIIVKSRNFFERHVHARPAPIILQFAPMRQCPLLHNAGGVPRKITFNHFPGFDRYIGFLAAIARREMRRRMFVEKHPDGD